MYSSRQVRWNQETKSRKEGITRETWDSMVPLSSMFRRLNVVVAKVTFGSNVTSASGTLRIKVRAGDRLMSKWIVHRCRPEAARP